MSKLNIISIFPDLKLPRPIIISGPCSAETEVQTIDTAKALSESGIKIFRAGIWKPRTRPRVFEGVGKKGLIWLKKVKNETGMKVCVEVACKLHVRQVIESEIDAVWIGSRTSVNPFVVQEIADALVGSDLTVFVKNPVSPDLDLWIGALERINGAGITKLAAIHRGFSVYGHSKYRNPPQWQIPIELRRQIPNLPILTDPSHICGNRDLLREISQEAMDLNFDGLMIESHINPTESWSDSQQQVSPSMLKKIVDSLLIRNPNSENKTDEKLNEYRKQIDVVDYQLIDLLKERMNISEIIGKLKHENNLTIFQSNRYKELLEKRTELAQQTGLNPDFIEKIFKLIHEESVNKQNDVMNR